MKLESVWTENEAQNVKFALRERYGDLAERTLVKYAVRELVEIHRIQKQAKQYAYKARSYKAERLEA